jgi:hypothetical protein
VHFPCNLVMHPAGFGMGPRQSFSWFFLRPLWRHRRHYNRICARRVISHTATASAANVSATISSCGASDIGVAWCMCMPSDPGIGIAISFVPAISGSTFCGADIMPCCRSHRLQWASDPTDCFQCAAMNASCLPGSGCRQDSRHTKRPIGPSTAWSVPTLLSSRSSLACWSPDCKP